MRRGVDLSTPAVNDILGMPEVAMKALQHQVAQLSGTVQKLLPYRQQSGKAQQQSQDTSPADTPHSTPKTLRALSISADPVIVEQFTGYTPKPEWQADLHRAAVNDQKLSLLSGKQRTTINQNGEDDWVIP
jgi:hypothetical protein